MSGQFNVGEVLVGQKFVINTSANGMECVVVRGLHITGHWDATLDVDFPPEPMYRVRWADGNKTLVRPVNLRRKQPPAGEQSIMDMFKLPAPRNAKEAA